MDAQAFQLLMERFDRVDEDNREIKKSLNDHLKESDEVNKVVANHTTYWKLTIAITGGMFLAVAGSVASAFIK